MVPRATHESDFHHPDGAANPPPDSTTTEATRTTEEGANEAGPLDAASLEKTTKSPGNTAQTKARPVERENG